MFGVRQVFLVFASACLVADARVVLRQPEIATKVAGLEGEACGEDEHKRYQQVA